MTIGDSINLNGTYGSKPCLPRPGGEVVAGGFAVSS